MTIELAPPIEGDWLVLHPPGHASAACDLVGADPETGALTSGAGWRLFAGLSRAEDFHGWDRPVRAPADGRVVSVADDVPDRHRVVPLIDIPRLLVSSLLARSRLEGMAGNHVLLDVGGGHVLLAHLRRGSVSVRAGDRVTTGQLIGRVGNSGASLGPHLHLQLSDGPDVLARSPIGFLLPYREWADGRLGPPTVDRLPERRRRVRFAAASRGVRPSPSSDGPSGDRGRQNEQLAYAAPDRGWTAVLGSGGML